MKLVITLSAFLFTLMLSAQTTFKVKDEISYFDGVDWIDSEIIQVGEGGKYLVYGNRAKTKTVWCKSDDIELLTSEVPDMILETRVDYIEIRKVTVIDVNDTVYVSGDGINAFEAVVAGRNEEKGEYMIYADSARSSTRPISENYVVLKTAKLNIPYKDVRTVVTKYYKVGEIVKYKKGEEWSFGTIENINRSSQFLINGEWFDADNIDKQEE